LIADGLSTLATKHAVASLLLTHSGYAPHALLVPLHGRWLQPLALCAGFAMKYLCAARVRRFF
jgi:hypothetical protein